MTTSLETINLQNLELFFQWKRYSFQYSNPASNFNKINFIKSGRIAQMSPENKPLIATRAILVIDGRVLLGRRGRGFEQGKFALIGGKPDGDETPEQAVIREVLEETGLIFKNPILFYEEENNKTISDQTWHTYYFIGETSGGLNLKLDEVPEVIYVGPNDLDGIEIAFIHKDVLKNYFKTQGSSL